LSKAFEGEAMLLFRVLALLLPMLAWHGTAAWAQEPLKIGLSGPFTGGSMSSGAGLRDGARLAAEEINAAGGIDVGGTKRLIQLVERNDQSNNELGIKIAQELVRDEKVIATTGFVNTGVALASQLFYQVAKVPVMNCAATGSKITTQFTSPNYIFRNSASDLIQASMIAEEAVARRHFGSVAIFADKSSYGQHGRVDLEIALSHWNAMPVDIEMFKTGEKDMLPPLTRAKDAGTQAILTYASGADLAAIANGMEKLGWKVPIIGSWTLASQNFIDGAGANSEGTVMPQTFIQAPSTPKRAAFIKAYQKRFGVDRMPSPPAAAQCYDAIYLLAAAIEQAKSTDGPKIREALENLGKKIEGVVTTYDHPFTADDHEAISANIPVLGMVRNGRVVLAHPEDVPSKTARAEKVH
jgi:branched-chain amino acid transport system substrate-binding protein